MRGVAALALALGASAPAAAQDILDIARLPTLKDSGRAAYQAFLAEAFPRAFAMSDDGSWGWRSGVASDDAARDEALASCGHHAKQPCRVVAIDNDAVVDGRRVAPASGGATHGELTSRSDYFWYGPARAQGALVYSHGRSGQADLRKSTTPAYVRRFSNAGWDVYRFDRDPRYDELAWAIRKLTDGARQLRAAGYRRVIAAGHSRGAWQSLEVLREGGVLDGVIAGAPAHHGTYSQSGAVMLQGLDDYRTLIRAIAGAHVPVALFVFGDDPYDPDPAERASYARARLGAGGTPLLVVERPSGITGHNGPQGAPFNRRFGACVLEFIGTSAGGPATCPDGG
jgi:hypothetical protein